MNHPERTPHPRDVSKEAVTANDLAARREHSLLALAELGRALDLRLNERELAQLALFNLIGHFGTPRAAIWLKPEEDGPLEAAATVGISDDAARKLAQDLGSLPDVWPVGEAVHVASSPWLGTFADTARDHHLHGLARLDGLDGWLGFVAFAAPGGELFESTLDRELLAASLGIVAAAIENQRLIRSLNRGNAQLLAANERMRELDRLRSEMLQNLNHAFRTPIAIILGAADCLRNVCKRDGEAVEFIEMIANQSGQVREMITMLLDHAELMSMSAHLPCEPTDIATCVRQMVDARSSALAKACREVVVTVQGEGLGALVEPMRFRRALDELLTNALKFSSTGEPVSIGVARGPDGKSDRIVIEIRDRGHGMTAEQIRVAFQPFRQGDGSSTRKVGGLGIGLTACARILELMDGTISLESEVGRGTLARVELRAA